MEKTFETILREQGYEKFIFTFGMSHELTHHYLTIWSYDYETARRIMFQHHGRNWAFQYTEKEWEEAQARHSFQLETPLSHFIVEGV